MKTEGAGKVNSSDDSGNSEPPLNGSWLQGFQSYITDIRSLSGLFSKGVFLAPIIAGLLLNLGPPWPSISGVAILTSLVEILVSIYIFNRWLGTNKTTLDRRLSATLAITVISLISYLLVFSFFVKNMPDGDTRDVKGIYYTIQAARVISPEYPEAAALRGAGYDPTQIWAPWTVHLMRVVVTATWLLFFSSLSAYIALFVLRNRNDPIRNEPNV